MAGVYWPMGGGKDQPLGTPAAWPMGGGKGFLPDDGIVASTDTGGVPVGLMAAVASSPTLVSGSPDPVPVVSEPTGGLPLAVAQVAQGQKRKLQETPGSALPPPPPPPQERRDSSAPWYPANPYLLQATRDAEARGAPPPGMGGGAVVGATDLEGYPVDLNDGTMDDLSRMAAEAMDESREAEDAKRVGFMGPALEEKLVAAEDGVDKVVILVEPVLMDAAEELRGMQMQAIAEVEREVKVATSVLSLAKLELQRRTREAESMAPSARLAAEALLRKYNARLEAATARLGEHRNVRMDHETVLKVEQEFGELAGRLAGVEVECERASVATEPLVAALESNPEELQADVVREAEEALKNANTVIAPAAELLTNRLSGLKGSARNKLMELQARMTSSQLGLEKVKKTVDECKSRIAAGPILKLALECVSSVPDTLHALLESEKPFLTGDERMPPHEAEALLRDMDKACSAAEAKLKDVQTFLLQKAAEAESLTSQSASKSILMELERAKKQISDGLRSVHRFQGATTKRRRANFVAAIRLKVEEVEVVFMRAKDVCVELRDPQSSKVEGLLAKARKVEKEAQDVVSATRNEFEEKLKGLGPLEDDHHHHHQHSNNNSGEEVLKTKVRVAQLEEDLARYQKAVREFEEKLEVERSLAEISKGISDAEVGTDNLLVACRDWPRDRKPPIEDEKALATLQTQVRSSIGQVATRLRVARGLEERELQAALCRLQLIKERLDRVHGAATELRQELLPQILEEVAEVVQKAEEKMATASAAAAALSKLSVDELEPLHKQASAALEPVLQAQRELADIKAPPLMSKVGADFNKLQARCRALSQQGKAVTTTVAERLKYLQSRAVQQALLSLRKLAEEKNRSNAPHTLYPEFSKGQDEITVDRFAEVMASADLGMTAEQVQLAYKQLAPNGLYRQTLALALSSYRKVVRDISLTTEFEVKSERLRKLAHGELLEVTGEAREDVGLSLERLQCRAVKDGITGWVTIQSNAGSAYLAQTEKPFLWCTQAAVMHQQMDVSSPKLRTVAVGEVVELLEGPRDGPAANLRVPGAQRDGSSAGWLQVREGHKPLVEPCKDYFRCEDAVAMTDVSEVAQCRMLRRIDAGEVLEVIDGEAEIVSSKGGKRRKFRAISDGLEGWVTTQGNQGTAYVGLDPRHVVCKAGCTVYAELAGGSPVVQAMEPGTIFVATSDPQELPGGDKLTLYHVRTTAVDFVEGWVAQTKEEALQSWRRQYEVLRPMPMTKGLSSEEELRKLEAKELVDILDHPAEDGAGRLRARCISRDGLIGWVTVVEGSAPTRTLLLRPAPPELLPPPERMDEDEPPPPEVTSKAVSSGKPVAAPAGGNKGKPPLKPPLKPTKGGKSGIQSNAHVRPPAYRVGSGGTWTSVPSSAPGADGGGNSTCMRTMMPRPRVAPSSAPSSSLPPPPPAPALHAPSDLQGRPVGGGPVGGAVCGGPISGKGRQRGPPPAWLDTSGALTAGKGRGKGKVKGKHKDKDGEYFFSN